MSTTDNAATSAAQPAEKPAAKSNYQVATMAIRHDGKAYQVGETIAQPQQASDAQRRVEPRLDLRMAQPRVAIGVEQALFGRDEQPGAVGIDSAAFKYPWRHAGRQ